jgi:carbonic anhydrase
MKSKIFFPLLLVALVATVWGGEPAPAISRDQALRDLRAGNARYEAGKPQLWNAGAARRKELTAGQHPKACIVTCSDSRVSPELLFDQSIGDVFVVRLAGNVIAAEAEGSVEYAVEHLHVPLVVVLGHSSCGAIAAALSGGAVDGQVGSVLDHLQPAIQAARQKGTDPGHMPDAVVRENALRGAAEMVETSPTIGEAVKSGHLAVISAVYDLPTGKVDWQMQWSAPVCATPHEAPAVVHVPSAADSGKPAAVKGVYAGRH